MNDATRIFGLLHGTHLDSQEENEPNRAAKSCHWPDCQSEAPHKAPASPSDPDNILWFCRQHAREHNAKWDFFEDMGAADIEQFRREDVTWHKPTWKLGANSGKWWQDAKFPGGLGGNDFFGDFPQPDPEKNDTPPTPQQSGPVREALSVLRLDKAADWGEIKVRYKELVKRYHPDANGGSKKAEDKLKRINSAYGLLKASYRQ